MSNPTLTQRLLPLLEKLEVEEWKGEEVLLHLRECPQVRVEIKSKSRQGPGGSHIHQSVCLTYSACTGEVRSGSLNKGMASLAEDLEKAAAQIREYLEWTSKDEE